jgi:hypothetical protein
VTKVWIAYRNTECGECSVPEIIGAYSTQTAAEDAIRDDKKGSHVDETLVQSVYKKYKLYTLELNILTGDMGVGAPQEITRPLRAFPDISGYTDQGDPLSIIEVERLTVKVTAENSLNAVQEVHLWWLRAFKDKIQLRRERTRYIIESSTVVVNIPTTPAETSA